MRCLEFGAIFFLFSLFPLSVCSQDSTNADGLYAMARIAAFDQKDYPQAIHYAKKAIALAPAYGEVMIFIGRVYTWSEQPDSARTWLKKALNITAVSEEAHVAYADLEYSAGNYNNALAIIDPGMQNFPRSVPLMIRKARVYEKQERYPELRSVALDILAIDRKNAIARSFLDRAMQQLNFNAASVSYDLAVFDEQFPDPWHFLSLDYTTRLKSGSFTARVNFADRLSSSAIQYELEAYPRISKRVYVYVNIGAAPGEKVVFPEWRGGLSIFYNLAKGWETDAGIRYLYYSSGKIFYTASVGKYVGKYLVGLRGYVVPDDNNTGRSFFFTVRRFTAGADYLQLNIGGGLSPDDRLAALHLDRKLRAYSTSISYKRTVGVRSDLLFRACWQTNEFQVDQWGNQFNLGAGFRRIF